MKNCVTVGLFPNLVLATATKRPTRIARWLLLGLRGSPPHRTGGLPATHRVLFYYTSVFVIRRVARLGFCGAIFVSHLKGVIFVGASTNAQPIGVHDPLVAD